MSIDLNVIVQTFDDLEVPVNARSAVISLALARAVGYALSLPTSEVSDTSTYYHTQHQTVVDAVVSTVNEQFLIDVEKTRALVHSIWLFRYRLVFNANNSAVRQFLDSIVRVGSIEFPGYVSELMITIGDHKILDYMASLVKDEMLKVLSQESVWLRR